MASGEDDDAPNVPRSERPTPRLPSQAPPWLNRKMQRVPTDSYAGLRHPSVPPLEMERVSSRPGAKPGSPGAASAKQPASNAQIQRSIDRLVASDRRGAAADLALAAGRHEEALTLYLECGSHHAAGACLRRLGRFEEAICHLTLTPRESPHYREACREVAAASMSYGSLPSLASSFVAPFAESGPRSDQEIPAFLDLAELYWAAGERRNAERCLIGALRLDPQHETAQLMQLTWKNERARGDD